MINANDYETIDDLANAMQLEYYISELEYTRKTISSMEFNLKTIQNRYDTIIRYLRDKEFTLNKHISLLKTQIKIN